MKSTIKFFLIVICALAVNLATAQMYDVQDKTTEETDTVKYGPYFGAVTIDGNMYQQIGFRGDLPIGKLGLGLDLQFNVNQDGRIYKGDWDEWTDYLDKIYYVRWAHKGAPFYFKLGGLDYSYLGYANVINGYTNMIEFPTVKRWGLEMQYNYMNPEGKKKFGIELFMNDLKEPFYSNPSMIFGTRLSVRPLGKLEFGVTYVTDLNEYNGFKDSDDDGYPDKIDLSKYDPNGYVTRRDSFASAGFSPGTIDELVQKDRLAPWTKEDMFNINDNTSQLSIFSLDVGYPIIERNWIKMQVYSHYTKIVNYGWGTAIPGFRFQLGERDFLTLAVEYRVASDQFLYGYFNQTYENERAIFIKDPNNDGRLIPFTRQERLENMTENINGIFGEFRFNFFGFVWAKAYYQDLKGETEKVRSIKGEFGLGDQLQKMLPVKFNGYYVQDNVEDFSEWKTPSTLIGALLMYNYKGVDMGFDYRFTFQDMNGDGLIRETDETIKSIAVKAGVKF